jgi:hypothetical protein
MGNNSGNGIARYNTLKPRIVFKTRSGVIKSWFFRTREKELEREIIVIRDCEFEITVFLEITQPKKITTKRVNRLLVVIFTKKKRQREGLLRDRMHRRGFGNCGNLHSEIAVPKLPIKVPRAIRRRRSVSAI